ncbi:YigZ family protein [Ornithinimicrobium ciconiae]|uniref:YigZ family protein n=1 Tax=Ornithinimicrobium ciconiae TaxID=2594265 RepID=A0A516G7J6_9MICO|nr:YigZ family protein [Ornithinimicrobium ciconiae]QDO87504.1 YigZ family protein [Ornithinimicrobium ciconiae]
MSRTAYRTVRGPVTATIEERRSVFECWLRRVDSEEAARAVVEEARTTHWDARHHCSAWVLGPEGDLTRSNDDGEPSGTAGIPMLEALSHSGFSDVVAVVTRWFGGTLLGTGGLVRAYGDAVRTALAEAVPQARELRQLGSLAVGHADAGRVEHELRAGGVLVTDADYGEFVTLHLAVPVGERAAVTEEVARLTGGGAEFVLGETEWVDRT